MSEVLANLEHREEDKLPVNYSTTEKVVGTWIDGKPLYEITVDFGALPNASAKTVNHGVTNIDKIVYGIAGAWGSNTYVPIPMVSMASSTDATYWITATLINITTESDRSALNGYVTFRYTKTTD